MFSNEQDARYFRRRAVSQTAIADAAHDPKVRDIHRELATMYEARARLHASRAEATGASG